MVDNDYISRANAVQCARDVANDFKNDGFVAEAGGADTVGDWLQDFPAADVRHVVKAHWTDHRTNEHDGEWYCSACGKAITIYMGPDRDDRYSYCPNCGADMREAHDGI